MESNRYCLFPLFSSLLSSPLYAILLLLNYGDTARGTIKPIDDDNCSLSEIPLFDLYICLKFLNNIMSMFVC